MEKKVKLAFIILKKGRGESDEARVVRQQVGKTMLAAVVMKEILKRRYFRGHDADTYEWVPFGTLKSLALERDNPEIGEYQTCDWLVVDDIVRGDRGSENMRNYSFSRLDSVFTTRMKYRLPTILVFQFNVIQEPDLSSVVGAGMAMIVRDSNTIQVNLDVENR